MYKKVYRYLNNINYKAIGPKKRRYYYYLQIYSIFFKLTTIQYFFKKIFLNIILKKNIYKIKFNYI
jgi:hypothetical protein